MKKLIRGLKDVSPFFVSSSMETEIKQPTTNSVPIDSHLVAETPADHKNQVEGITSCFTILSEDAFSSLLSNQTFVSKLRKTYHELYVLRSMSQKMEQIGNDLAGEVQELTLTSFQVEDLLHLEPIYWSEKNATPSEKNQCFFLDPKLLLNHRHLFQMLDRVILHVSAKSPETIAHAYQILTACLHENPHTRFSLFVNHVMSDEALEVVCERFAAITSRFLGCEVDFLGFSDGSEVELNDAILRGVRTLDEIIKDPLKTRLKQLFLNCSELGITK